MWLPLTVIDFLMDGLASRNANKLGIKEVSFVVESPFG